MNGLRLRLGRAKVRHNPDMSSAESKNLEGDLEAIDPSQRHLPFPAAGVRMNPLRVPGGWAGEEIRGLPVVPDPSIAGRASIVCSRDMEGDELRRGQGDRGGAGDQSRPGRGMRRPNRGTRPRGNPGSRTTRALGWNSPWSHRARLVCSHGPGEEGFAGRNAARQRSQTSSAEAGRIACVAGDYDANVVSQLDTETNAFLSTSFGGMTDTYRTSGVSQTAPVDPEVHPNKVSVVDLTDGPGAAGHRCRSDGRGGLFPDSSMAYVLSYDASTVGVFGGHPPTDRRLTFPGQGPPPTVTLRTEAVTVANSATTRSRSSQHLKPPVIDDRSPVCGPVLDSHFTGRTRLFIGCAGSGEHGDATFDRHHGSDRLLGDPARGSREYLTIPVPTGPPAGR